MVMIQRAWFCVLLGAWCVACSTTEAAPTRPAASAQPAPARSQAPARRLPVQVDTLAVTNDMPAFALQSGRSDGVVGVVLHGHCGHGLGFLQAFQFAAADAGRFLSLQGDRPCHGALRSWSLDVVATDRRIDQALRTYLGETPPETLVLVGSSQGAKLAVALARRFPKKYTRLVLLGAFETYGASGLSELAGAHFFVGEHENVWPTRETVRQWNQAGIHAEFTLIEGAGHADWRGRGNPLISEAFKSWGLSQ